MPTFLYLSSGVVLATVIAFVCDLTLYVTDSETDLNSDQIGTTCQPNKGLGYYCLSLFVARIPNRRKPANNPNGLLIPHLPAVV